MILVVDDDDDVRDLAADLLTSEGFNVCTARNGDEGLATLKADPSIVVLFTDIVMPGSIDGWELADQAKQLRPDLRVIYTSGFTKIPSDGIGHGPLLPKPWRRAQLCDCIKRVIV